MYTRKQANTTATLLTGLLAGLVSQVTTATEEVVVYGDDVARQARATELAFQLRMHENARSLNDEIKAIVENEIGKIKAPNLQLALGQVVKRG